MSLTGSQPERTIPSLRAMSRKGVGVARSVADEKIWSIFEASGQI
jgi:hypothetical protein